MLSYSVSNPSKLNALDMSNSSVPEKSMSFAKSNVEDMFNDSSMLVFLKQPSNTATGLICPSVAENAGPRNP